jgi:hypothetical protein
VVSAVLAAVLVFGCAPVMGLTAVAQPVPQASGGKSGDDGTTNWDFIVPVTHKTSVPAGYTAIRTAAELDAVRNNLSGSYILMNDIDLAGWGNWETIGNNKTREDRFSGIFDGNGYVVSNISLDINRAGDLGVGLFKYVENGKIQNVGMSSGSMRAISTDRIAWGGGIASTVISGNIANCFNKAEIYVSSPWGYWVGGIVGCMQSGSSVKFCYSTGQLVSISTLSGYDAEAGGIAGYIAANSVVSSCYNSGDIAVSSISGKDRIGGITAEVVHSDINDCYNKGNVYVASPFGYAGGIVANVSTENGVSGIPDVATVQNCYNVGNLRFQEEVVSGSIAARIFSGSNFTSSIKNCYSLAGIGKLIHQELGNPNTIVNVTALSDAQMRQQSSFVGFDFDHVWKMPEDGGYPILQTAASMGETYTVTYNANGGTGAPAAQTKTKDVPLTLSNVTPTRTGYTFGYWSTKDHFASSTTDPDVKIYYPSATYTENKDVYCGRLRRDP